MPVLRDLYSGSKKSTSAYLPAYSLSIAAQPLSRMPFRNLLHNSLLRVTMQTVQNTKRFPSGTGESSPETGREAFLTT